MPRASRRRRRHAARGLGQSVLVAIAATVTLVLVGGSLLAIHTQSQGYRNSTTAGYIALADPIGQASTRTGARLAAVMDGAASLPDTAFPATARGILQQGLDSAVRETADQAAQAANLASPPPEDDLASRFTRAMDLRASATAALRSTVDRLLGMQPLPVAGAPSTTAPAVPTTQISTTQASSELAAEGRTFEQADALFRAVRAPRPPTAWHAGCSPRYGCPRRPPRPRSAARSSAPPPAPSPRRRRSWPSITWS